MYGDIGYERRYRAQHVRAEFSLLPVDNLHSEYNHNELSSRQHLRTIVHNLHHFSRVSEILALYVYIFFFYS